MLSLRSAVLAAVAVAVPACHHNDNDQDAWQLILDQVQPNGRVSKDTALAAFALAIGPLPDVPNPPGKRNLIPSGTLAVDWLRDYETELTDAQRAAVAAYLGPAPTSTAAKADDPAQQRFAALADNAKQQIAAKLQVPPDLPPPDIVVVIGATQVNDPRGVAGAVTVGYDANGEQIGEQVVCKITIQPVALTLNDRAVAEIVPHEVFHCFLNNLLPTLSGRKLIPPWVKEGTAEWVGDTLAGHADNCTTCWREYLTTPGKSLFRRNYDALGFFAELDADGLSPWNAISTLVAAVRDLGNTTTLQKLAMVAPNLFPTWASSYVRDPALGAEWDLTGPGITADKASPKEFDVGQGGQAGDAIAAAANGIYLLSLTAEVIALSAPDQSRLHSKDPAGFSSSSPRAFWCTRKDGCTCPDGSAHSGESPLPMLPPGSYYLSVPGALEGSQWSAEGLSLSEYCNGGRIDPCLVGTWTIETSTVLSTAFAKIGCEEPHPFGATTTFGQDGAHMTSYDSVPTFACSIRGNDYTFKFSGQAQGTIDYARHGLAKGTVSNSTLKIHETVNGLDLGDLPLGDLLGGGGTQGYFTQYTCSKSHLTLVDSTGNALTLSR